MPHEAYELKSGTVITIIEYQCSACDAIDRVKYFQGEQFSPALNCWNCGRGKNLKMHEQVATGEGMFKTPGEIPVPEPYVPTFTPPSEQEPPTSEVTVE